MKTRNIFSTAGLLIALVSAMAAQDSSTPQTDIQTAQQPIPAYGQENRPAPVSENPPLSGLDLPSLQEHAAPLSYLQPGATVSESADTNIGNAVGGTNVGSISRAEANVDLKRLWSHYDLALDYIGGAAYYTHHVGFKQLQDLGVDQKILWKRGQLSLRDSFSYLPEGNFGGSYGSLGSADIATMGNTAFGSFWGGSALGAFGLTPRILNVSLAELTETMTPKSSVTAAGGYAITHFFDNGTISSSNPSGVSFIGSSQVSIQGGYNRTLTSHTQIAAVYGYQAFDFSVVGTSFHSHVIQGMYGHRISGRMDLLLGAGPQITLINEPCTTLDGVAGVPGCSINQSGQPIGSIPSTKLGVAAQARLRYRFTKSSLDLRYERFETSGGGIFAGAQSDVVRLGLVRPLSRVWSVALDVGFTHNARLQPLTDAQQAACQTASQGSQNACPANDATSYNYGFVGGALHRQFGHNFHGFASYQFDELAFDHSFCATGTACGRISNRQVLTFGLDWTPRPIRID